MTLTRIVSIRTFLLLSFSVLILPGKSLEAQGFCDSEKEGGPEYNEFGIDIDADNSGNFFMTGAYRNNCEFGGVNYTTNGSSDFFLAKYNSSGNLAWNYHMGGSGPDRGVEVFWGEDNMVYVAGSVKLAPGPNEGPEMHLHDALFVKFDTSGSIIWIRTLNGNNYSDGNSIVAAPSGISFCAGIYNTLSYLDNDTLVSEGSDDIMLISYGPNGGELWSRSVGSIQKDEHPCVGADAAGNIYLAGQFADTLFALGNTVAASAGKDIFILKLDANGDFLWARGISGSGDEFPNSIQVEPDGSFYIAGNFNGNIDLNGIHTSLGSTDGFLAKFDAAGNTLWEKYAGGTNYNEVADLATDPSGNVYFNGWGYDTLELDVMSFPNGDGFTEDFFFASFNSAGTLRFADQVALPGTQYSFGMTVDPGELMYFTGSFVGTVVLGNDTLVADSGTEDIFWARYSDTTYLKLDSISGPPSCINDAFSIWFTARGCFGSTNIFTAEISDSSGNFSSPLVLGTLQAMNGGSFICSIPPGVTGGGGYRVRLVSDNPTLISNDNGFDFALSTVSSTPPQISGDTLICAGDTVLLDAGTGYATYSWSTSAISQTILVTQPGTYSVNVTDALGCTGFDSHEIATCISAPASASSTGMVIFPNPASAQVQFSCNGEGWTAEIFNTQGQPIQSFSLDAAAPVTLDVSQLSGGVYWVKVSRDFQSGYYRLLLCK